MRKLQETVLYPAKTKNALSGLGMLALVAISVWAARMDAELRLVAWILVPILGFCAVLFLSMALTKRSYLRLDEHGFTVKMLFRQHTVPWTHVESLWPASTKADDVVRYVLKEEHRGNRAMSYVVRGISRGGDGDVIDYYGLGRDKLTALMNTYLECYGRR